MEFEGSKTPWHIGSHPFEYRNRHTIRSDDNPMAGHNKPIQAVTIGKMTISQFGDGQLWIEEPNGEHGGSFRESDIAKLLEEYHAKNF